jgi:hypothetical protein
VAIEAGFPASSAGGEGTGDLVQVRPLARASSTQEAFGLPDQAGGQGHRGEVVARARPAPHSNLWRAQPKRGGSWTDEKNQNRAQGYFWIADHRAAVGQDRVYLVDVLPSALGLVPGRWLLRNCASVGFEFVDAGVCGVEFVLQAHDPCGGVESHSFVGQCAHPGGEFELAARVAAVSAAGAVRFENARGVEAAQERRLYV